MKSIAYGKGGKWKRNESFEKSALSRDRTVYKFELSAPTQNPNRARSRCKASYGSTQSCRTVDATLLYGRRITEDLHLLHEEEDEQCTSFNIFPEFFSELKNKYIKQILMTCRLQIKQYFMLIHHDSCKTKQNQINIQNFN